MNMCENFPEFPCISLANGILYGYKSRIKMKERVNDTRESKKTQQLLTQESFRYFQVNWLATVAP